jgi:predicted Zn-dependent protease
MKIKLCIYILLFTCIACHTTQEIHEKNLPIAEQTNKNPLIKPAKALSFAQQFSPSFYTQTYQTLQLQNKTYQKVRKIFDRVINASGIEKHRTYKLIIIDNNTLEALSFPDGTVVISTGVIDLCYLDVAAKVGDGRLAFILGHELAHLSNNDFWHLASLDELEKYSTNKDIDTTAIVQQLVKSHNPLENEFRADATGILYASMAGYQTKAVLNNEQEENLFEKWFSSVSHLTQKAESTHPDPMQRAVHLISSLQSIVGALDIFSWGVRLFQIGKYDDAISFFKYFSNNYPSREVLNNLGLSYLKKAIKEQFSCNDHQLLFQLSTLLDPKTRASGVRGCDDFHKSLDEAVAFLKEACNRDPHYLPSKINLAAAMILSKDYHAAISTLKGLRDHPSVENNQSISHYLMGKEMDVDLFDKSHKSFLKLIKQYSHYAPAYYNIGRLYYERGEYSIAETHWLNYLKYSPYGIYADNIRKTFNISENLHRQKKQDVFIDPPLIPLGEMTAMTEKELESFNKKEFEIDYMPVIIYSFKGYGVLVLDWEVVCVEGPIGKELSVDQLLRDYGKPHDIFENG